MKIVAYKAVVFNYYDNTIANLEGKKCYLNEFIEAVNEEINDGWQPYGDMKIPTIDNTIPKMIQVMVKYEN